MNQLLFGAGVLAVLVGLVHSILGELLIFHKLRNGGIVPTRDCPPLRSKNVRILWATWHIASLFGWAFAALLFELAFNNQFDTKMLLTYIGLGMFSSGLIVLYATRARHPGWLGLCGVAILCWTAL